MSNSTDVCTLRIQNKVAQNANGSLAFLFGFLSFLFVSQGTTSSYVDVFALLTTMSASMLVKMKLENIIKSVYTRKLSGGDIMAYILVALSFLAAFHSLLSNGANLVSIFTSTIVPMRLLGVNPLVDMIRENKAANRLLLSSMRTDNISEFEIGLIDMIAYTGTNEALQLAVLRNLHNATRAMLDVPTIQDLKAVKLACFVKNDQMLDILFDQHPLTHDDLNELYSFATVGRRDVCTKRIIQHKNWERKDISNLIHYTSHTSPVLFDDLLAKEPRLITAMNSTLIHAVWSQNIPLIKHILYSSPFSNSRFASLSSHKVGNNRIFEMFAPFERSDDDWIVLEKRLVMDKDEQDALEILHLIDRSIVPFGRLKIKRFGKTGEDVSVSSIIPDVSDYKEAIKEIMKKLESFRKQIVQVRPVRYANGHRELHVKQGKQSLLSFSMDGSNPIVDQSTLIDLNRHRGHIDGYRRLVINAAGRFHKAYLSRALLSKDAALVIESHLKTLTEKLLQMDRELAQSSDYLIQIIDRQLQVNPM